MFNTSYRWFFDARKFALGKSCGDSDFDRNARNWASDGIETHCSCLKFLLDCVLHNNKLFRLMPQEWCETSLREESVSWGKARHSCLSQALSSSQFRIIATSQAMMWRKKRKGGRKIDTLNFWTLKFVTAEINIDMFEEQSKTLSKNMNYVYELTKYLAFTGHGSIPFPFSKSNDCVTKNVHRRGVASAFLAKKPLRAVFVLL